MNNELLQEYFTLHEQFGVLTEKISEDVRTLQDQWGHLEHEVERKGVKSKLTEKILWEEVYLMGLKNHEAANILRAKYPDVFATVDESEELQKKIRTFELTNLGFSFSQMNGANLIKLVKGLIELYAPNKNI